MTALIKKLSGSKMDINLASIGKYQLAAETMSVEF